MGLPSKVAMCPPTAVPCPADISLDWTYEELSMFLDKHQRGSPLPSNVTADINPYNCLPSDLRDGILYIVYPEDRKYTKIGYWKARGEACEIFTNSVIICWRTTFEFYEGQSPHGQRTEWVMQEYKITQKELCYQSSLKASKSLCRVFCTDGQSLHQEPHSKLGTTTIDGGHQYHSTPADISKVDNSTREESSTSACQVKNREDETGLVAVAERHPDPPVENTPDKLLDPLLADYEWNDHAEPRGDYLELGGELADAYLELDDLVDPRGDYLSLEDLAGPIGDYYEFEGLADHASRSSSSDNSSCVSSEECFESFDVSAPVRSNEVAMLPATLGSPSSGNGKKFPMERTLSGSSNEEKFLHGRALKHAGKRQRENDLNGAPTSSNVTASGLGRGS